jgi:ribonucleoside-diphosphate reductase alpha chain
MSKMWYDNEISMGIMTRKYLHPEEKPEDFIPRVVSIFSDELKPKAQAVLENAHFLPAGRTLFGAGFKGKRKLSISNCYVIGNIKQDNIEAIFDTAKMVARIFSYGGGCGISIDTLRPKGSPVNNSAMTSSGAVSFLNIFDSVGSTIGQNGRRAALMVCLKCNHPDIEEFLRIKQNNEKLSSMNISIKFTDDFMKAVEENRSYTLYFESEETGRIEKVINARDFFMEFCETQWNWGDPGAIFIDRVQNYHILAGYENEYVIDASNPCSEAFGISGFSCNLGSINVYNMVDCRFTSEASINYDRLKNITDISVRMLDEILDYGRDMQPLEVNKTVIDDWRNIGLGIFGLADAFVALGVKYGSPKSCEITENIIKT